jgi:hypothetical protein
MGKHCPIKCTSFSSERDDTVLQWAFQANMATVGTCGLKGYTLMVNMIGFRMLPFISGVYMML